MKQANYYKSGKRAFLEISQKRDMSNHCTSICTVEVSGKIEARKVAKKYDATCYNF